MTDSNQWASPGSEPNPPVTPPPPPVFAGYGPPAPGPAAPGAYGVGAPNAAPPGWTPPPKPGLIPLRPLGLGDILGASFSTLRRNPRPTFGTALVIKGITGIVTFLIIGGISAVALGRIYSATSSDVSDIGAGAAVLGGVGTLISAIFSVVGDAILQGIIALEVASGSVGEKLTFRGLWSRAKGRIGALIGWALLLTVVLIGVVVIAGGLVAVLVITGGSAGAIIGALLGIILVLGLTVLFIWIGTKLSFVPSAIVIERMPIRAAIARSWSLVRGSFWRIFGISLLVNVIISIAAGVVTAPVSLLASLLSTVGNPNNDPSAAVGMLAVSQGITTIIGILVGAVTSVIVSATAALLYIDLRMRKEGLDLQLTRFVEARAAGTDLPDPYRTADETSGTAAPA